MLEALAPASLGGGVLPRGIMPHKVVSGWPHHNPQASKGLRHNHSQPRAPTGAGRWAGSGEATAAQKRGVVLTASAH